MTVQVSRRTVADFIHCIDLKPLVAWLGFLHEYLNGD